MTEFLGSTLPTATKPGPPTVTLFMTWANFSPNTTSSWGTRDHASEDRESIGGVAAGRSGTSDSIATAPTRTSTAAAAPAATSHPRR